MTSNSPKREAVQAWALLLRVSKQLLERVEDDLKRAGLPPLVWYDVLHELAEAGDDGVRPGQLVETMLLAQYNVSRLLARMEKQGLVARSGVEGDGRGQTVSITAEGRKLRRAMWAVYGPAIAELVGDRLDHEELELFAKLLTRLKPV